VADDIRSLSAALARDPASLQYVDLAEALRKRGKLDEALQVVMHGLGRHAEHADGYDCLARIHSDRGDLLEARMAWERTLAIEPEHGGALKGIGFLFYRQGDLKRATDALEHALAANPDDWGAQRAIEMIRESGESSPASRPTPHAPSPEEPRRKTPAEVPQLRATAAALRAAQIAAAMEAPVQVPAPPASRLPPTQASGLPPVFEGLDGSTADILLLDSHGLVMAGGVKSGGQDVSELAAAALAGVSGEASRTATYLNLGSWYTIVAEAEQANVVLTPVGDGALLMLRRTKDTPVGLAVRIADRAKAAAARWLEQQA
jgi:tetratricopeptide (TPR) repeat protein